MTDCYTTAWDAIRFHMETDGFRRPRGRRQRRLDGTGGQSIVIFALVQREARRQGACDPEAIEFLHPGMLRPEVKMFGEHEKIEAHG